MVWDLQRFKEFLSTLFFPWIFVDKNHRKFRSYLTGCHTCYTFNMVLSMSEMVRSASFRHNLTPLAFEKKTIGRFTLILLSDILGFFKSTVVFLFCAFGSKKLISWEPQAFNVINTSSATAWTAPEGLGLGRPGWFEWLKTHETTSKNLRIPLDFVWVI